MQVIEINGGAEGNRTPDLVIANVGIAPTGRVNPSAYITKFTHFIPKLRKTAQRITAQFVLIAMLACLLLLGRVAFAEGYGEGGVPMGSSGPDGNSGDSGSGR